ncbi:MULTISPECIES: IclR family transcriptional regulator [Halomonadaceae]|mgnify:FL=1|uniref:IclR family transcriptional regulator n=1 Tax=Halomonadaceae TaxID=28256 RepID=UPI0018DA2F8B|nr:MULTISPECIES: IclR family transcriptional regulator [Halomonas]MCP1305034.1 IclR family transcriptional regulator [Halomonas sp. R1t8]MCP1318703.1 IclR family transcriptional regulator [Halomonas sp. 707B3]MCP1329532.1 IclR family transcriptional regulator [Halomonas sp. R1t4]MCC4288608.1 IclR family transcriptional regulator [Halomonas meridiana]MCD1652602.1 IclR family transcriptional regulator [Halomonas axialensis]
MKTTDSQGDYQIVVDPMNTAGEQEEDRQFVTALARGLELLRCFTPSESALSNLDLAKKSGLPRPTVSRLTHTLARLGYLRPLQRGKYQLDVGVMSFGYSMISNLPVRAIAQPLMVNLANEVGATVAMSARDRLDMVYLDVVQSALRSTIRRQIGTRLPIHQSSAGRACLAAMPTQESDVMMNHLRDLNPTEWPAIRRSLERAFRDYADHGYCLSIGEWQRKVNAVAVPLHHPQLGVLAFNCGGPEFQISREKLEESIGPQLVQLVNDIKTQIS